MDVFVGCGGSEIYSENILSGFKTGFPQTLLCNLENTFNLTELPLLNFLNGKQYLPHMVFPIIQLANNLLLM